MQSATKAQSDLVTLISTLESLSKYFIQDLTKTQVDNFLEIGNESAKSMSRQLEGQPVATMFLASTVAMYASAKSLQDLLESIDSTHQ